MALKPDANITCSDKRSYRVDIGSLSCNVASETLCAVVLEHPCWVLQPARCHIFQVQQRRGGGDFKQVIFCLSSKNLRSLADKVMQVLRRHTVVFQNQYGLGNPQNEQRVELRDQGPPLRAQGRWPSDINAKPRRREASLWQLNWAWICTKRCEDRSDWRLRFWLSDAPKQRRRLCLSGFSLTRNPYQPTKLRSAVTEYYADRVTALASKNTKQKSLILI